MEHSVIIQYVQQCGLEDIQKINLYGNFTIDCRKVEGKVIAVTGGDFNCHVESITEDFEDQNGGYGYEMTNSGKGYWKSEQLWT